jgi:hypothetical protein
LLGCKAGEASGDEVTGAASGAVVVVADVGAFGEVGDDGPKTGDATGEGATGEKFGATL